MKKAYLFAATSILFWSTSATVSKLMLNSFTSYQVLMFGALFAALALFAVNMFNGKIKLLKKYKLRDYLIIVATYLPGCFLYNVFLYMGMERMTASQAFIINYLWPIMSVVFSCIILHDRVTVRKGIAFGLSFLGVLTVAGGDLLKFNTGVLIGGAFCVLAAVSYGAFTALNRRWEYDYCTSVMISYFVSFVLTALINLVMGERISVSVYHLCGFAWNGIFIMALGMILWSYALKLGGTARIANLAYVTPFLSLVWTFLILKEPIKPLSVIGLAVIVAGIFIQLKDKEK